MSIKSEKAKADVELLQRQLTWCELNDVRFGIKDHKESRAYRIGKDVENYVIQAESDARERAVRAFRMACDKYNDGRDMCWHNGNLCNLKCNPAAEFFKFYDNE